MLKVLPSCTSSTFFKDLFARLCTTESFVGMENHRKFQVPKMEVLNRIRQFGGSIFFYISLTYSIYRSVPPF